MYMHTYLHKTTEYLDYNKVVELMDVSKIGHSQQTDCDATPYSMGMILCQDRPWKEFLQSKWSHWLGAPLIVT